MVLNFSEILDKIIFLFSRMVEKFIYTTSISVGKLVIHLENKFFVNQPIIYCEQYKFEKIRPSYEHISLAIGKYGLKPK